MSRSARHPAQVLALSTFFTVLAFLAIEAGVRLAGIEPQEWPAADLTFKLPQLEVDPLLGPLAKPGWSGRWFRQFETEIDARGFRATGIPSPPDAERRVVFMGDSCTFGWGVDTAETFVAQLASTEKAGGTQPFELLNAAYPGHSASVGVYMLRERVLPLQPDIVVLGYSANNAFRFSLVRDEDRFRFFSLRKLLLRSRLFHILAAKMLNRAGEKFHPRARAGIMAVPFEEVRRVAPVADFDAAMRTMVADARDAGALVFLLVFPRASGVSTQYGFEDAALSARIRPLRGEEATALPKKMVLFEASCLDHEKLENPMRVLLDRVERWQPVYPADPAVRDLLRRGASAYVRRELAEATAIFGKAVALAPRSPLARYDLGVSQIAAGQKEQGLGELNTANELACNVFLQYQILTWKVAAELDVPVVDLALFFQSHDGEELFLDPAHPNVIGHRIIAEAMWETLSRYSVERP